MYTVPMQASSHCRHTFLEVLTDQTTLSPHDTHLVPLQYPGWLTSLDGSRLFPHDTHLVPLQYPGWLTSLDGSRLFPQDTHLVTLQYPGWLTSLDGSRLFPHDTHLVPLQYPGWLTSLDGSHLSPQDTHLYPYSTLDAHPRTHTYTRRVSQTVHNDYLITQETPWKMHIVMSQAARFMHLLCVCIHVIL